MVFSISTFFCSSQSSRRQQSAAFLSAPVMCHRSSTDKPCSTSSSSSSTCPSHSHHGHQGSTPRRVFFDAAFERMMQQPTRKFLSTLQITLSYAFESFIWWVFRGFQYVIPVLYNSRQAIHVPLPTSSSHHHHYLQKHNISFEIYPMQQDTKSLLYLLNYNPKNNNKTIMTGLSLLNHPVTLFIHGGAWGSGKAWQFSTFSSSLRQRCNTSVLVLSYPVYPTATIETQINTISYAMTYIRTHIGQYTPFLVYAHSSGAHIVSQALLQNSVKQTTYLLPDVCILTAGVFHLAHHYLYESRRGVAAVSPMQPAANADQCIENFLPLSPSVVAETLQHRLVDCRCHRSMSSSNREKQDRNGKQERIDQDLNVNANENKFQIENETDRYTYSSSNSDDDDFDNNNRRKQQRDNIYRFDDDDDDDDVININKNKNGEAREFILPSFLEGDIPASNIPLPPHMTDSLSTRATFNISNSSSCSSTIENAQNFPKIFLMASSADTTVPLYSSIRFAAALRRAGAKHTRLLVYDGIEHADFLTHWFDASRAAASDLAEIFDVDERHDVKYRMDCVRALHGPWAAEIVTSKTERRRAETAHLRDVLRIYETIRLSTS